MTDWQRKETSRPETDIRQPVQRAKCPFERIQIDRTLISYGLPEVFIKIECEKFEAGKKFSAFFMPGKKQGVTAQWKADKSKNRPGKGRGFERNLNRIMSFRIRSIYRRLVEICCNRSAYRNRQKADNLTGQNGEGRRLINWSKRTFQGVFLSK